MEKITLSLANDPALSGVVDKTLKKLALRLGVSLALRGDQLLIDGDAQRVPFARHYFEKLNELQDRGHHMREEDLLIALDMLETGPATCLDDYSPAEPLNLSRKSVSPKSLNQQAYIQAIKTHDLVFGIGPAGTGKTYLAMAMALAFLQNKSVSRIILTRPAVEAGEKLGFLPGDLIQKVNPYLRPLYDALFDLSQYDQANRLIERGVIEIAPLAFMRGRTLNGAFIILDEAQNTTREQMKMILTRTGFDSKLVITADVTQIDLPQPGKSGVLHAMKILANLPEISFIRFSDRDVVRHPLVQKIIKAYQKAEAKEA
ncbi:MAG TPA: PhoH family protein [Candidatus Aminicenantes bacterium]|nr:PhoH family protein [Candidatus Aminicenantes bacterium]HRY66248.1 PhoH family protein [Candidatus Aminicenantes bacterium]HRZ73162.1 PhoH family protein [Candidatus Aminicenantes bacterium]